MCLSPGPGSRISGLCLLRRSILRIHARPARRIFSNALNFCRSAIAVLVRSPCRYCPFRSPGGPPLPLAPPCNRQRPFFVAGDRQGFPLLVRAPHCQGVWNCTGCWFCLLAFIGSLLIFCGTPPPSMADIANDSLSVGVHMDMLDPYFLFAPYAAFS